MAQEMKPFSYKKNYLINVEKAGKGIYNFKVYFNDEVIIQEEELKKKTMFKVGDHIRSKIDEYEVEAGIVPEVDEQAEIEEAIEDLLEKEEEEDDEEEDDEDDGETTLMAQFEEETGKSAMTSRKTIRKDYIKWKEQLE